MGIRLNLSGENLVHLQVHKDRFCNKDPGSAYHHGQRDFPPKQAGYIKAFPSCQKILFSIAKGAGPYINEAALNLVPSVLALFWDFF